VDDKFGFKIKVRFPWHVSHTDKSRYPTVVDADGMVVAQILNGGVEAAERIVTASNRVAENMGLEEV
jgi:hypothetical protein